MNAEYTMFDYDAMTEAELWDLTDYYYTLTH